MSSNQINTLCIQIAKLKADLKIARKTARDDALEEAAKVAGDKFQHTVSWTTERDMAEKLCPRIAAAIRALKGEADG